MRAQQRVPQPGLVLLKEGLAILDMDSIVHAVHPIAAKAYFVVFGVRKSYVFPPQKLKKLLALNMRCSKQIRLIKKMYF